MQSGAIVIDNSSAHRMQAEVPLVVPEINGGDVAAHRGIIANPNCTTAIALMALYPSASQISVTDVRGELSGRFRSRRAGHGRASPAIESDDLRRGRSNVKYFPSDCLQCHPAGGFLSGLGYTKEELKLQNEARRIMHLPSFKASVTCVRVPVFRAHCVAVNAEFQERVTLAEARQAIISFRGIELRDDPTDNVYPMPVNYAGEDVCAVGRLRIDSALENGLAFWVCGDQLLKGAALNAVQIAELL